MRTAPLDSEGFVFGGHDLICLDLHGRFRIANDTRRSRRTRGGQPGRGGNSVPLRRKQPEDRLGHPRPLARLLPPSLALLGRAPRRPRFHGCTAAACHGLPGAVQVGETHNDTRHATPSWNTAPAAPTTATASAHEGVATGLSGGLPSGGAWHVPLRGNAADLKLDSDDAQDRSNTEDASALRRVSYEGALTIDNAGLATLRSSPWTTLRLIRLSLPIPTLAS